MVLPIRTNRAMGMMVQATAVASVGNSLVVCGLHIARVTWRDFMPYKNSASPTQNNHLTGYYVVKVLFGQVLGYATFVISVNLQWLTAVMIPTQWK